MNPNFSDSAEDCVSARIRISLLDFNLSFFSTFTFFSGLFRLKTFSAFLPLIPISDSALLSCDANPKGSGFSIPKMSFSFVSLFNGSKMKNEFRTNNLKYNFELHLAPVARRDAGEGFLNCRFASFMSDWAFKGIFYSLENFRNIFRQEKKLKISCRVRYQE